MVLPKRRKPLTFRRASGGGFGESQAFALLGETSVERKVFEPRCCVRCWGVGSWSSGFFWASWCSDACGSCAGKTQGIVQVGMQWGKSTAEALGPRILDPFIRVLGLVAE